jgi:hypothetical protein
MSLKLTYYGQNDSVNCTPAVILTGDPGTDQQTLTSAKYLGGVIVALADSAGITTYAGTHAGYSYQSSYEPAMGSIGNIVPCDTALSFGNVPFAVLLNGPGEFAGAIGPSGSRKAPVVRALWQGNVDFQGYVSTDTFVNGQYVYCSSGANFGLYTVSSAHGPAIGICTHVPTSTEPWLGVASLI